jgi:hypothetical protein
MVSFFSSICPHYTNWPGLYFMLTAVLCLENRLSTCQFFCLFSGIFFSLSLGHDCLSVRTMCGVLSSLLAKFGSSLRLSAFLPVLVTWFVPYSPGVYFATRWHHRCPYSLRCTFLATFQRPCFPLRAVCKLDIHQLSVFSLFWRFARGPWCRCLRRESLCFSGSPPLVSPRPSYFWQSFVFSLYLRPSYLHWRLFCDFRFLLTRFLRRLLLRPRSAFLGIWGRFSSGFRLRPSFLFGWLVRADCSHFCLP